MGTIICTTGTSVVGRKDPPRWDPATGVEVFKRLVFARVEGARSLLPKDQFLDEVSAETKSLRALKASRSDRVFLLHTDTEDGRVCAEVIADILFRDLQVEAVVKRVAGLQVRDAQAFRRQGVDALFGILMELTAGMEYGDGTEVILNVTGGFKAVVPFVTLFGLLRRFDVTYIFELSDSLIRLPPLPVQYDFERLGQAAEAIRRLRSEGVMRREDFYAAIPGLEHADRRWYECLLEEVDGMVALSAVATHLLDTNTEATGRVLLHSNAKAAYEKAGGSIAREQFNMMLSRVGEPLWRKQKRHIFKGTDFEVYKPGNTAERMVGFLEGRNFYVCELFSSHDEYERVLNGRNRHLYKRDEFRPWVLPVGQDVSETPEQLVDSLGKRLVAKEKECCDLELAWLEVQKRADAGDAAIEELKRGELAQLANTCAALKAGNAEKDQRLIALNLKLEMLQRPWWKRLLKSGRSR